MEVAWDASQNEELGDQAHLLLMGDVYFSTLDIPMGARICIFRLWTCLGPFTFGW